MSKKLTTTKFIENAKSIHGNKYDYSLVEYVTDQNKVKIICPIHGVFEQKPHNHVHRRNGCFDCRNTKPTLGTLGFISKAKEIHGDKYDYSLVEYVNQKDKIKIICPVHGVFEQLPGNHIYSQCGCQKCGNNCMTLSEFISKAKEIHGDKYDYSLVNYIDLNTEIKIICPTHGEFLRLPNDHIYHQHKGCSECYINPKKLTNSEFIEKAKLIHGDKYDYNLVEYNGLDININIICPVHGVFEQLPGNHIYKEAGCSSCSAGKQISKGQEEVFNFISSLVPNTILEDRTNYPGLMLDITIPSKNLAIEYNGIYWHAINNKKSSRYMHINHLKDKLFKAQELGLRVINIYEDEWQNSRSHIEQIIKNALGSISTKIMARKCKIWSILTDDPMWNTHVKPFFKKFHHQGLKYKPEGVAYCLTYNNQIQAIAYFGINSYHNQNDCELIRYATRADVKVVGGLSKLVTNFLRANPQVKKIKSYCDARLFTGDSYRKAGFKFIEHSSPGFDVISGGNNNLIRKHRSCIIKNKLSSYFTEEEMKSKTQMELAAQLGWYAVPDCGQLVFEYTK